MSRASWPVNSNKSESSRFSDRHYLNKKDREQLRKLSDIEFCHAQLCTCICTHMQAYAHKCIYTNSKLRLKFLYFLEIF